MSSNSIKLEKSWKNELHSFFETSTFKSLKEFLIEERKHHTIYPSGSKIFSAFDLCPFESVKVVIIGQDPYHGPKQANGLCFSVSDGVKPPPSLQNIFKEIQTDLEVEIPKSGNLEHWAKQGVLMLNATLTVRAKSAGSHQKKGWEEFTDLVIQTLSNKKENLIFILWGKFAQNKATMIDQNNHFVLKAAHPSPFSAHSGFFGCKHFSKTNAILHKLNKTEINWLK